MYKEELTQMSENKKSALDHINGAVKEGTYSEGFKDGTEYVIGWLDNKRKWLREHNGAFYDPAYFLEVLLEEYRDAHDCSDGFNEDDVYNAGYEAGYKKGKSDGKEEFVARMDGSLFL
jgi:hypothetical protein